MTRIRLVHWNADEGRERALALRGFGFRVDGPAFDGSTLGALKSDPPDAVVVDLTRSPSQGRDLGVHLRRTAATRAIPLVFVGGEPDKVSRVRELLPDAEYASWRGIRGALKRALANKGRDNVVPSSSFAAYAGTPLPRKLGIKPGAVVALVGAPGDFESTLGRLPDGVKLRSGARGRCDLAIWFARSRSEVERRVAKLGAYVGDDGLWILWPKKASGVESDLSQAVVRKLGLDSGLVDYKVCSVDATWSGLKFTRRK